MVGVSVRGPSLWMSVLSAKGCCVAGGDKESRWGVEHPVSDAILSGWALGNEAKTLG